MRAVKGVAHSYLVLYWLVYMIIIAMSNFLQLS